MGNANISGIGRAFAQGQSARVSSDMREEEDKINFLDMMNQMAAQPGDELFSKDVSGAAENALEITESATDNYDRYRYRESSVKSRESAATAADEASISEKLSDYAEDVKEVLKEELGVTDEQIEEAMDAMGITVMDLMNPKMLAELAATLTGCESISELLCNSDFMAVMQKVGEFTEQLLAELGISMEELTQMVQTEENPDMILQEKPEETAEQMSQDNAQMNAAEESAMESAAQTTEEPAEAEQPENVAAAKNSEETVDDAQAAEGEKTTAAQTAEETAFRGGRSSENGQMHEGAGHGAMNQNLTDTVLVQGTEQNTGFTGQVDVSDIMKQIAEFSRITVQNAATTMEMQLNPEHLGKIYLEITSKAGTVSAHITAQNEIVKEALEAQIVELKENMNQAGVKIDAVEVTVGSHEFEKNLEQNAKQEERQAEEQEKAAKQTRHINLNDLDELNGLMTEEETLVAQMMAEQGNSVDYTA